MIIFFFYPSLGPELVSDLDIRPIFNNRVKIDQNMAQRLIALFQKATIKILLMNYRKQLPLKLGFFKFLYVHQPPGSRFFSVNYILVF